MTNVVHLPVRQPAEPVPTGGYMYASQREAQQDLLRVTAGVIAEIVAANGKLPPMARMVKDFDRVWEIWRFLAPPAR